jgi:uncharacterized membrane protein YgcG
MFLIVTVILCYVSSVFAEQWRVFDSAKLFAEEEIKTIEQAIFEFQRNTKYDFAVLTTDDYLGKNSAEIARAFAVAENLGFGQYGSGVIYYLATYDGMLYPTVSCGGEMRDVFDQSKRKTALETVDTFIENGEYAEAALRMIESATEAVQAYKKSTD